MLPEEVRRFIVQRLACFETPSEVAAAVKELYGKELSRQQVAHYDPEHSLDVAGKWRELHAATRAHYLQEESRAGIAHQVFRLHALDEIYHRAKQRKNDVLALAALEQAAKEKGGAYTSRRELTGRDGAPLAAPVLSIFVDGKAAVPESGPPASSETG